MSNQKKSLNEGYQPSTRGYSPKSSANVQIKPPKGGTGESSGGNKGVK